MNRRWTPDDDRLLREHHAAGWSMTSIMRALDRSKPAVETRLRNLGLSWAGREYRMAQAGTLQQEIAQAKREAPTAPLYRPGDRV